MQNAKLSDDLELRQCVQDTQNLIHNKAAAPCLILQQALKSDDQILVRRLVQNIRLLPYVTGYDLTIDLTELANSHEIDIEPKRGLTTISVPMTVTACNNGKKLIIGNKAEIVSRPNPALIKALKLAHEIKEQYLERSPAFTHRDHRDYENEQTAGLAKP